MNSDSSRTRDCRVQTHARSRGAMSLVEMVVVMALTSMLLATAIGLLVQLRRWDYRVRENAIIGDETSRLAEAIRADVRNSASVTRTSPTVLTITSRNAEQTRYTLETDLCRRENKSGAKSSANLETFSIGASEAWKVDAAAPGRHPAYAISVERPSVENATSRTVPLYIYAVQGTDSTR